MRRFVSVVVFAAVALPVLAARPAWAQSKQERAIRALIDRNIQANNSVDEKLVKQATADLGTGAGPFYPRFEQSAGSTGEIETLMMRSLTAASSRTFTVTEPVTIHAEKKTGWANYTWHTDITLRDGTKRSFDGRTTAAFALEGKNWKYVHWHNSIATPRPKVGKELEAEEQAIIKLERDGWEAYKNKQIEAFNDYYADEASAFMDDQAYRVRGKADILRGMEGAMKQSDLLSYQMLDPQVHVLGDTALLTYYSTFPF